MNIKGSYHNHTHYSDGTQCARSMVLEAIAQGLEFVGISDHSPLDFPAASRWWTRSEQMRDYTEELSCLKQEFSDRICVLSGLELDIDSDPSWGVGFDYIIGAVHQLTPNGDYCSIDYTIEDFDRTVAKHFAGDVYAYTRAYFEREKDLAERKDCPIVAHFDLVSKFSEKYPRFDETDTRYIKPALDAMEALVAAGKVFELNTGGISRGWKTVPYPSPMLLKALAKMGGRIMLAADAHKAGDITAHFEQSALMAKACGFNELWSINSEGLFAEKINV